MPGFPKKLHWRTTRAHHVHEPGETTPEESRRQKSHRASQWPDAPWRGGCRSPQKEGQEKGSAAPEGPQGDGGPQGRRQKTRCRAKTQEDCNGKKTEKLEEATEGAENGFESGPPPSSAPEGAQDRQPDPSPASAEEGAKARSSRRPERPAASAPAKEGSQVEPGPASPVESAPSGPEPAGHHGPFAPACSRLGAESSQDPRRLERQAPIPDEFEPVQASAQPSPDAVELLLDHAALDAARPGLDSQPL